MSGKNEERVIELTSYLLHQHYCKNNAEGFIPWFDKRIHWFGAAENEYILNPEALAEKFHQFAGKVPKCNITDEDYHVIVITPEVYLCTGRMWKW